MFPSIFSILARKAWFVSSLLMKTCPTANLCYSNIHPSIHHPSGERITLLGFCILPLHTNTQINTCYKTQVLHIYKRVKWKEGWAFCGSDERDTFKTRRAAWIWIGAVDWSWFLVKSALHSHQPEICYTHCSVQPRSGILQSTGTLLGRHSRDKSGTMCLRLGVLFCFLEVQQIQFD